MTREMPDLRRNLLDLFAVINSPILVYTASKELLYSLWPTQATQSLPTNNLEDSLYKSDHNDQSDADHTSARSSSLELQIVSEWQLKRQEVLNQAQKQLEKWQRSIGEPLYLQDTYSMAGLLLASGLYILIGPITPLRLKIKGETVFVDNQTARNACKMWLNIARDQCRVLEHSILPQGHIPQYKGKTEGYASKGLALGIGDSKDLSTNSISNIASTTTITHQALASTLQLPLDLISTSMQTYPSPSYEEEQIMPCEQFLQSDSFALQFGAEPFLNKPASPSTVNSTLTSPTASNASHHMENPAAPLTALPTLKHYADKDSSLSVKPTIVIEPVNLEKIEEAINTAYDPYNGDGIKDAFAYEIDLNELQQIKTVRQHNLYRNEVLTQEAIREGDVSKLQWAYQLPNKGKIGILGPTPLRSWQNHAHLHNVLASRAAIDAGVTPEEAYTLSDRLFLLVEEITDPLLAKHMRYVVAKAFTDLVHQHKAKLGDSVFEPPLVRKVRSIIQKSLTEKITLGDLASKLNCSEQHLCRLFKSTHKQSIMQYVTKQRIHLAKDLLRESDTSIGDIASLLQFSSTAHFCRVFKQFEQLTPAKWRLKHALTL